MMWKTSGRKENYILIPHIRFKKLKLRDQNKPSPVPSHLFKALCWVNRFAPAPAENWSPQSRLKKQFKRVAFCTFGMKKHYTQMIQQEFGCFPNKAGIAISPGSRALQPSWQGSTSQVAAFQAGASPPLWHSTLFSSRAVMPSCWSVQEAEIPVPKLFF